VPAVQISVCVPNTDTSGLTVVGLTGLENFSL